MKKGEDYGNKQELLYLLATRFHLRVFKFLCYIPLQYKVWAKYFTRYSK